MEMQIKELEVAFGSHKSYSVFVDNNEIETLVTHDHAMVRKWVNSTENSNRCRLNRLIVGLDTEWRKNPVNNCYRSYTVATLQLCVGKSCLVFQILHARTIPLELRQFLENPNYKFVGVGVDNDIYIPSWAVDELGMETLRGAGLKTLVKCILGKDMQKPKTIAMSEWDKLELEQDQVAYACLDAYFSFEIGRQLSAWY
ncbi:hypothetical protein ABFX02_09G058700 [Erythranthe guttata]